jgi:hypothetical protein
MSRKSGNRFSEKDMRNTKKLGSADVWLIFPGVSVTVKAQAVDDLRGLSPR